MTVLAGCNGLISSVTNLTAPVSEWICGGVPITMMCHMERRHGNMKPVIKKALVELDGEPFKCFTSQRDAWAKYDLYRSPGPIQFFANRSTVELSVTLTLELLKHDPRMNQEAIDVASRVRETCNNSRVDCSDCTLFILTIFRFFRRFKAMPCHLVLTFMHPW